MNQKRGDTTRRPAEPAGGRAGRDDGGRADQVFPPAQAAARFRAAVECARWRADRGRRRPDAVRGDRHRRRGLGRRRRRLGGAGLVAVERSPRAGRDRPAGPRAGAARAAVRRRSSGSRPAGPCSTRCAARRTGTACAVRRSPRPGTVSTAPRPPCSGWPGGSPAPARQRCWRRPPPSSGCVISVSGWPAWSAPSRSAPPDQRAGAGAVARAPGRAVHRGRRGVRAAGRGRGELGGRGRQPVADEPPPGVFRTDRGDRPAARHRRGARRAAGPDGPVHSGAAAAGSGWQRGHQ